MNNDSWYQIDFTNDQIAAGVGLSLVILFAERYLQSGAPKGAALLDNCNPNPFEAVIEHHYYLTPNAVPLFSDIIRRYGGEPCSEPPPTHSTHLAGDMAFLSEERLKSAAAKR
jgi:hypothetical protein